ncbi:hypothetical protein BJF86_02515 [Serinicoccus sp. CNJ-927]|uniref:lipopolysaccharide biosynthesis protein n=1 Tax=Serinicoccus sp. CNJ-927 TaxID=1904970 RepID=UPI00096892AF|nr:lipopolysaccharide biosynthesis protein [Serinicoccus sp. CNJ-927]OLT41899.1 hypothetical protein BJF86_02515 [Serinicoccus sp. CNJ-927]
MTKQDKEADLRQEAAQGVLWATLEKWLVRGSTLLGFVILGRLIDPVDFGVAALAMVFVGVLTALMEGGFSQYLVQRRTMDRAAASTVFFGVTGIGIVLGLGLLASSGMLADLLNVPVLEVILPTLSGALVLSALAIVPASLMQRQMQFRELAMRQVLATVLSVVVAVALAIGGLGVWALIAQTLVRLVVSTLVIWIATDFKPQWTISRAVLRELSRYSSATFFVGFLRQVSTEGEGLLIAAMGSVTALGYWTVANRILRVVSDVASAAFSRVTLPVLAKVRDDPPRLRTAFKAASATGMMGVAPLLVLVAVVASELVPLVFGSKWQAAVPLVIWLTFRGLAESLQSAQGSLLLATGKPWTELWLWVLQVAGQFACIALVISSGLPAVAAAIAGWSVFMALVRTVVVSRVSPVHLSSYSEVVRVLGVSALAGGVAWGTCRGLGLDGVPLIATSLLVGGILYLIGVRLFCRESMDVIAKTLPPPLARRSRWLTGKAKN